MSPRPESADFQVRVTPRSSRNKIEVAGPQELKIWVTAPPVDGEANAAVCQLLAKALDIAKSRIGIVNGDSSRNKTIRIEGLSVLDVLQKLTQA